MKSSRLLAVTLAIVLVTGFGTPAFSENIKNKEHPLVNEPNIYLPAVAPDHVEVGDAGESINTAQDPGGVGALNTITGSLINLGTAQDEIDDVDLYSLCIKTPSEFSVLTEANLSEDNDAQLFLFDSTGSLVIDDDDGGVGFLPQFDVGDLTTPAGVYYLAINLYDTDPNNDDDISDGWNRAPIPYQTGPYTLTLTSTEAASSTACTLVGGESLSIDSTALILAGAQTNAVWILSALAVIGSVAFGALYITSKKN